MSPVTSSRPTSDGGKRLYSRDEVEEGIYGGLDAETVTELSFDDTVDGEQYRRRVLGAILRKA